MAQHNDTGSWGEQVATEYLITKGYTIRETDWRCDKVEIDIVAEINRRLVIVEVKTRSDDFVDPLMAVDVKKQHNLVRAANAYINYYDLDIDIQFDITVFIPYCITPSANLHTSSTVGRSIHLMQT